MGDHPHEVVLQVLTLSAKSLMPRNSSAWHNLYDCVVQTLDHWMDPSSSHIMFRYLLLSSPEVWVFMLSLFVKNVFVSLCVLCEVMGSTDMQYLTLGNIKEHKNMFMPHQTFWILCKQFHPVTVVQIFQYLHHFSFLPNYRFNRNCLHRNRCKTSISISQVVLVSVPYPLQLRIRHHQY